ncbi:hypothetical protein [Streptomyces sp. NPDC001389]|uniref:hypothetical protein n=1 Tax=Streptomyces sp. NPDC001389 TaxID=3364569 RepID=UPI00368095EA
MLTDVLTGWTAETLGGLTLLAAAALGGWLRRRRSIRTAGSALVPAVAPPARTYTLLGVRAADGQPVHLPSSRPAGTRVAWSGPVGKREEFELTDAVLADGTYAAERLGLYRTY